MPKVHNEVEAVVMLVLVERVLIVAVMMIVIFFLQQGRELEGENNFETKDF